MIVHGLRNISRGFGCVYGSKVFDVIFKVYNHIFMLKKEVNFTDLGFFSQEDIKTR